MQRSFLSLKGLLILGTMLSISYSSTFGQSESTKDTAYFKHYDDYFLVRAGISNRTLDFSLTPRDNFADRFTKFLYYRPNVRNTFSLGVRFKGVGVSFGYKVPQQPLFGSRAGTISKFTDIRINSYGKKIGFDLLYQQYKGFFSTDLDLSSLSNVFKSVGSIFGSEPFSKRNDLELRNYSANVYYVFNHDKFSYRGAFVMDQRQLKTSGSFILTGSISNNLVRADSSFVPSDTVFLFNKNARFRDAQFFSVSITPGYAYNIVTRTKLYATIGLSGFIGYIYHNGNTKDSSPRGSNFYLKGIGRASIGYHGDKLITGFSAFMDLQGLNTKHIRFNTGVFDLSLFIAYRFKTKWLAGRKTLIAFRKKEKV